MAFPNYQDCKSGIVAIVSRYSRRGDFPDILGTGFIARENGLIVTNRHVVDAIKLLPRRKDAPDEWPIRVLYFFLDPKEGMGQILLDVEGVTSMRREGPTEGIHYGPDLPDIGIIFVKATGLPFLEIEEEFSSSEGDEVFIAGFPMGTNTLRAPGWIHQINPVLQRGIVSSIQPFPCPKPHGLLIEAVTQGGSSGSPIFNPKTGKVTALLYGGLEEDRDIPLTKDVSITYKINTALTCAIPAYMVSDILKKVDEGLFDPKTKLPIQRDVSKHPTLAYMLENFNRIVKTPKAPISGGTDTVPLSDLEFPNSL